MFIGKTVRITDPILCSIINVMKISFVLLNFSNPLHAACVGVTVKTGL